MKRRHLLQGSLAAACIGPKAALSLPASAATDLAGRHLSLSKRPKTFVVANYIANFLFVGGSQAVNQIVGLTADGWQQMRYAEYVRLTEAFPVLKDIPSIGGYHDDILNTERILAIKPDVVLLGRTQYAANAQRLELLQKNGIDIVVLDYHAMTLANHTQSTALLGSLLGRQEVAEAQISRYVEAVRVLQERINALPETAKTRRVYVECGNEGTRVYGNSYNRTVLWGGILNRLQAHNIAADMKAPYAALSREFVLAQNPEIIFIAGSIWQNAAENDQMRMGLMVSREEALERLQGFIRRPLWERLSAVRNKQVFGVDHGSLRCMMDYAFSLFMAQKIYPGLFDDFNAQKEIESFFQTYLPEIDPSGTFVLEP